MNVLNLHFEDRLDLLPVIHRCIGALNFDLDCPILNFYFNFYFTGLMYGV